MRDVSGSDAGREVEAAFHKRIRAYIAADGKVWSHPGLQRGGHPGEIRREGPRHPHLGRDQDPPEPRGGPRPPQGRRVEGAGPQGDGRAEGAGDLGRSGPVLVRLRHGRLPGRRLVVPNGWNRQPAPIVGPLVAYWQATGDADGLAFARAYADGMIDGLQPGGLRFAADGRFDGHSHATMHAVWGVARLGLATGEDEVPPPRQGGLGLPPHPGHRHRLVPRRAGQLRRDLLRLRHDLRRGPDRPVRPPRILRLRRALSAQLHQQRPVHRHARVRGLLPAAATPPRASGPSRTGLEALRRFQGGIIGGTGLNDFENELLGGASGFEMFGCCAPEGMARSTRPGRRRSAGARSRSSARPASTSTWASPAPPPGARSCRSCPTRAA